MPRPTRRTAILRLTALTILLLIVACCVAPPEMDPPTEPIDPVLSAPFSAQSTPDDDAPDIAELVQHASDNLQYNVESLRTDKGCLTACRAAMVLPGLLSTVCLAGNTAALRVPSVYGVAFAIFCQIFKTRTVAGGGYLGAALGVGWCKDSFCKPTEGRSLK